MAEEAIKYQEVMDTVTKEVQALGAENRKNYEEIHKSVTELRKVQDSLEGKFDSIAQAKIDKLALDTVVRQEALDLAVQAQKAIDARIDKVEVTLQRAAVGMEHASPDEKAMAVEALEMKQMLASRRDPGRQVQLEEGDLDSYKAYRPAFLRAMRWGMSPEPISRLNADETKALSVGSDPDGGLFVTPQMSSRLIEFQRQVDPMRDLATVESIGSDSLDILIDADEADDGWETETVAQAETGTPQWRKKNIRAHWQSARPRATQQSLDDIQRDLEGWLAAKVSRKFTRTAGAAFVSGDGIGKPRGFLTYTAAAAMATPSYTTIVQVPMLAAAALTSDGLINVKFGLLEEYLGGATWLMNRLTVAEVMKLKDGDGQYIWRAGLQEAQPSLLLGLPLRMAASMPVVAANALSVVLAYWPEAYTIVDRAGTTVQRDPYTAKPFVEFYTRRRVGGDVVNTQAIVIGRVSAT